MSTGVMADLISAAGATAPESLSSLSAPGTSEPYAFADDWEVGSVSGLQENTSGPYCPGEIVRVEITVSSEASEFEAVKNVGGNYAVTTSDNCSLLAKLPPVIEMEVDSDSGDTTGNVIGITFDNAFNTGTGLGTEQTVTFDTVAGYDVTIDSIAYLPSPDDDVVVEYTIQCGTADYYVQLFRDNDGTPTQANSDTQTSTGSYTIKDTSPNSGGRSDEYRIDVTDEDGYGTTVSDTATVNL
jgi:hypothetical protein